MNAKKFESVFHTENSSIKVRGQIVAKQIIIFFLKKWANPGLFLFIFVLFNNNFTEKL